MAACGKCKLFGHNATAHRQVCAICGGSAVIKERVADVDPNWKCENEARHRAIRDGFGDPTLVADAKDPLPTIASIEKPLRGQRRFKVL
jgi:hypothetical protein